MKLELKHIVGYLPYGLKVQWENKEGESNILHVIGIHDNGLLSNEDNREPPRQWLDLAVCYRLKDRVNGYFFIGSFKPLLRPLSSLYAPLEDGSVPIVELAKIAIMSNGLLMVKSGFYVKERNLQHGFYHKTNILNLALILFTKQQSKS